MHGILTAVCVVAAIHPLSRAGVVDSAIDKRAVEGMVDVTQNGLSGDKSIDSKFHGGGDQAVYAYDQAEAARWEEELGRTLPAGWFGENLRVEGIPVTDAVIGSRWKVGTAELEVTIPRTPCGTFAKWSGEPNWIRRFTDRSDVGAYLRVVSPGSVRAGDRIAVKSVPDHGATVRDLFTGSNIDAFRILLSQEDLPVKVIRDAESLLKKADRAAKKAARA